MKKTLILYVPVIHQGYLELLKRHKKKDVELFVLGQEFVDELSQTREIRAIDPKIAAIFLRSLRICAVDVLSREHIDRFDYLKEKTVIISDDELSRKFAEKYLKNNEIEMDTTFLRWDEKKVFSKSVVEFERASTDAIDRGMMSLAQEESCFASDWWRHVGSVLVKNNEVIFKAHNKHLPSEHTPYMVGDPRDFIKAGKNSELASAFHSEQAVVAWAANEGVSLKGTSLYVTVFPCPVCAKLIAYSGIARIFYLTGHASLDGVDILKSKGVEIILVK